MRTKILSMMIIAAMIAVLFAGMAQADTQTAEAPQWTVGDKWAFGADEDLNDVAKPYIDLAKQEAASSSEVSNVDMSVTGTAGAWATFEVTGATDTEYTLDYRMSASVDNLKVHASATGDMPEPGTYSYTETPPTSPMTMSVDASLDHATVITGQIKFVRDTMAVKSVTIDVEQKTALTLKGKNLPGEDMLGDMGGLIGTGSDYGGYDGGYDTGTTPTYPSITLSKTQVGGDWKITIDSVSGDEMTWGNVNIDVYDVDVNLIESDYGTTSTTYTVYHSDGSLAMDSDAVQTGDYLIVNGTAGVDNLDFFYEDSYWGLIYLESVYNLASTTRDVYGYDGNYTISYQDYDISLTEEFHSSITINFEPPLNLLDFPINVGDQWDVYSNITVSGTYGGTIDASGLPDSVVQEIKNETGQDFPIDIAKLDMDSEDMNNGVISGSDTVDFSLQCTGTMQITDENGNSLTVFKIAPYYDYYSFYKGDAEPSVLYSPDRKFIAGTYIPAGSSPEIPGMSGGISSELSMLGGASTTDTTFTYADYNEASSNIDKTNTDMSSIGEPSLLGSNSMLIIIVLVVVILVVILAVAMRKKKPQQPQMAPYPDPYAPQQQQYPQYQQQPQQPPAYYPPQQPQQPPQNQYQQPPQNQTPPPPTY